MAALPAPAHVSSPGLSSGETTINPRTAASYHAPRRPDQPELFPDVRRPVAKPVNNDLARILGMLHGVARRELAHCRRDPSHQNWAITVGRAAMKNYGATARARIMATLLERPA